ncbi:MAG TPA: DUF2306 domain-containing protein [Rhizomicrobium sp.]
MPVERGLARIWLVTAAVLSVAVALVSFRFAAVPFQVWPSVDPGIRGVIERAPLQALIHMIIAPVALLVGPFQFFASIRARRPALHRLMGRIYVAACLVAGTAALATAPYASGGPIAGLGFGTLAFLWIASTLGAWRAAMARKFDLHRLLMRFSYALTFSAVTLRLQIPLGQIFFGFHSYAALSVWLAYTCWMPNAIVVALYSMVEALRRPQMPLAR